MKRIIIFLCALVLIYALSVVVLNYSSKKTITTTEQIPQNSSVVKEDLTVGTGTEAKNGDTVSVNYKGTLPNGKQFDSSYDRKEPYEFTIGSGEVIKGWDDGLKGMKVGGKRKLTIPPTLGYGDQANGDIPANSTLIFEVELLGITTPKESIAPINPGINL